MTTAAQSAPVEQRAPGAHFVAHVPPQSMSLSSPSRIRSVHDGAHEPLVQMPLMQLVAPLQPAPNPHFAGQLPPQSTSVSSPSFNPFEQALAAHAPSRQIPLVQSRATAQAIPFAHLCGQLPPQSTPVSAPFRTPSPQVASRQVPRMQDSPAPQGLFASSQMEAGDAPQPASSTRNAQARMLRRLISEGEPETGSRGGGHRGNDVQHGSARPPRFRFAAQARVVRR